MKIIYNLKEFYDLARPIMDPKLYNLPLEADTPAMRFRGGRYEELVNFCNKNPTFHLISSLRPSYLEINHAVPMAQTYFLADGSSDPNMIYVRKMTPDQIVALRISEFNRDERLAKLSNIKRSFEF